MLQKLIQEFNGHYQHDTVPNVYFAPGSLNLMGEHTDYNKGFVLPIGTSLGTYAIVKKRTDDMIRFYQADIDQSLELDLASLHYHPNDEMLNYPKGMVYALKKSGYVIDHGFDVLFHSGMPHQTGLSLSASMEMVTAIFLNDLFKLELSQLELVKFCKKVENNYIGINSGMMDVYTSGFSKSEHALFLNCKNLDTTYIPFQTDDYALLLMHTDQDHRKMEVTYNKRRNECELALRDLQSRLQIQHLCDITMETFANIKHLIEDPTLKKRVKHIVSENARTIQAAEFLQEKDFVSLGTLFNASHYSLKNDFGITDLELTTLTRAVQAQEGVLGAKMTGCCFGGGVIALVEKPYLLAIQKWVGHLHYLATNNHVTFDVISITDGAQQMIESGA